MKQSDHFDGTRFFNPGGRQARGFADVLRWKLTSSATPWPAGVRDVVPTIPPSSVDDGTCRITFVNHSTVLIQHSGRNILTDPVWSRRASPVQWAGPARKAAPGVRLDDLPQIDTVLLSHNHYDHLDIETLTRIAHRDSPDVIVPLGVSSLLAEHGIAARAEMDWWESLEQITCLPAHHFSARGLGDRNRTLWCSYWIETSAGAVYFAADTGFASHFAEIRAGMGRPRLALLSVGAYKPEWFMNPAHMSPCEAVEAHAVLGAGRSLAIHWGTFQLGDDGETEPLEDLERALAARPDLPPFDALPNGGVVEVR